MWANPIYCPNCQAPLASPHIHVWADVAWCRNCPPPYDQRTVDVLRALADPLLTDQILYSNGILGLSPRNAPILSAPELRDWIASRRPGDVLPAPPISCPLLSHPPKPTGTRRCLDGHFPNFADDVKLTTDLVAMLVVAADGQDCKLTEFLSDDRLDALNRLRTMAGLLPLIPW